MRKIVIAFFTIGLLSAIFTACAPPDPTSDLKLNSDQQEIDTTTVDDTNSATSQNYQLSDQQVQVQETNSQTNDQGETMKQLSDYEPIEANQVTLKTTKGDITFELYRDKAPITTLNFLTLAKEGFYDGIVFHRVIADFMAQAGDPLTKQASNQDRWGSGGPGYVIPDEFDTSLKHDSAGTVSMANRGPNTGGSQFFITFEPTPWLEGKHTIFGKVTQGLDVLQQITQGDKIISVSYQ